MAPSFELLTSVPSPSSAVIVFEHKKLTQKAPFVGHMQARALNNQEETLGQAITGVALWTPDINLYLHLPRSALPTLLCSVNFALPCPAVPCPAVYSVCACPCVV
eukprot:COSAG06_NODE_508_length_14925_cov_18.648995_12_plen_105_part_00